MANKYTSAGLPGSYRLGKAQPLDANTIVTDVSDLDERAFNGQFRFVDTDSDTDRPYTRVNGVNKKFLLEGDVTGGTGSAPEQYSQTINVADWALVSGSTTEYYVTIPKSSHGFTVTSVDLVSLFDADGNSLDVSAKIDDDLNITIIVTTTDGLAPDEVSTVRILGWK